MDEDHIISVMIRGIIPEGAMTTIRTIVVIGSSNGERMLTTSTMLGLIKL
jgi:hypothetical protein